MHIGTHDWSGRVGAPVWSLSGRVSQRERERAEENLGQSFFCSLALYSGSLILKNLNRKSIMNFAFQEFLFACWPAKLCPHGQYASEFCRSLRCTLYTPWNRPFHAASASGSERSGPAIHIKQHRASRWIPVRQTSLVSPVHEAGCGAQCVCGFEERTRFLIIIRSNFPPKRYVGTWKTKIVLDRYYRIIALTYFSTSVVPHTIQDCLNKPHSDTIRSQWAAHPPSFVLRPFRRSFSCLANVH